MATASAAGPPSTFMVSAEVAAATATKSTLVADSPPFNPVAVSSVSPVPPHRSSSSSSRSRSNSPYPSGGSSNGSSAAVAACGGPNPKHSNALPKYTFAYQGETLEIRNVWAENVEEELSVIREVIEKYPYVAMDTEFPGIVAKPVTETFTQDYHYKSLKVNVDLLKIIQLGLSFADETGKFAPGCPCWQFNFSFDLDGDMFAQDSIDLLSKSGISFEDHAKHGIDPLLFGELLMVSGLVLDDRVKWVSFHSAYDYGYLLKLLTTTDLPADEKGFFELLHIYFPTIYDIKFMTSILDGCHFMGGLQRLADDLGCRRLGAEHQAGSDSLLTMATYFALVRAKFMTTTTTTTPARSPTPTTTDENSKTDSVDGGSSGSGNNNGNSGDGSSNNTSIAGVDDSKYANELFGYGNNHTVRKTSNIHRDMSTSSALSNTSSDTL